MSGPRAFWAEHAWITPADLAGRTTPPSAVERVSGLTTGPTLASRVRIDVADTRITAVHTGVDPAPGDVRLPGVVFPGFANTHSHAFHRALRGRTHRDGGSFWTWRDDMYLLADRLTPDTYYQLARAAYAEMALSGVSVVGEFHYLHHAPGGVAYADPNAMGHALVAAAADAGVRLTLLDTCYLNGGIGRPLQGAQQRFGDGTAERWITRVDQLRTALDRPDVVGGAAVHSVRAVPPDAVNAVASWAASSSLPLHVHLSEQPAENDACLAEYGRTPTQLLADTGALGPATTAVHATHLTNTDITLLGRSGTTACACPTTEQDLADGLSPMGALHAAGSPVCLGSDQHAVVDLLAEARLLEMHERLASGQRGRFRPDQLVAALTQAGHDALGWPGHGRLAPGAAADLVAVRPDSVRTAGSAPDQIVLSAGAADVDTVVIGGNVVVESGRHRLGDVAALLDTSIDELWTGRP
ncbi:formimidoylglutamate deiminase [Phytoactinopolyspora limicola]|uniref:formimidoylglutamate deiminase n=1 Tax=Phytoactinopolyspora limicola TaxID=2715536 RepID=UPI00140D8EDF|nr:formimidoylglutamate deiminase [Phytoactinopolyspora limicola]